MPAGVEADVLTVNVERSAPTMDVGLKLAVAPAGRPLTDQATVPANPLRAVVLAV